MEFNFTVGFKFTFAFLNFKSMEIMMTIMNIPILIINFSQSCTAAFVVQKETKINLMEIWILRPCLSLIM